MRRLIFMLAFIPLVLNGQILTELSKYHDSNRLMKKSDNNFDSIRERILQARKIFNPLDSTISNLRYIDFDIEDGWLMQEGRTGWNDDDKTLEVGLDAGSVLQIGQEVHLRTLNNSGDTIPDGKAVRISGASGSRPTIALGNNTSDIAFTVIGISTQNILDGRVGYTTMFGLVRGLNTATWPAGTILWLDSIDGGLTATRPIPPNIAVVMGVVVRSNANEGIIGVKVIAVQRLAWLSDVRAQGIQTDWDILYWDQDSLRWELNNGYLKADSITLNGRSVAPTSPVIGQMYYDTDDNHFYGWTGAAWAQMDN